MKRLAFFFVFICTAFSLAAQTGSIIFLRGTVGKYKAQMTLRMYNSGKEISGFYQYEGKQAWLRLSGTSADGINLVLREFPQDDSNTDSPASTGIFTGQLSKENVFTGKWTSANEQPALDFKLHAECGTEGVCFGVKEIKIDTTMNPEGLQEGRNSVTAHVSWMESNSGNKKLDFLLDTFIFGQFYYRGELQGQKPVFQDYNAIADSFVVSYIGSESRMELSEGCDVIWNGHGVLCLESGFWEYTGGAHGYGAVQYSCFDLHTGKQLTTGDIFKKGYEEPLRLKAVEHLDRDPSYMSRDSLQLNGNFYVTPAGIVFFYNMYEITAYVVGTPVAFIPWNEIDQWIDPQGPMAWVKK
jgi:hypothetical protein